MIDIMLERMRRGWWMWWGCLLPSVLTLFVGERGFWLFCFFLGCSIFVVSGIEREIQVLAARRDWATIETVGRGKAWRGQLLWLGLALLLQWIVLSSLSLLQDGSDIVAPALALGTAMVSLCIAPYLTMATRKPLAAVVLTLFAVACMKFVAGAVTVLVYGWHATDFGHTTLTWTHPNLIVCTFLLCTAILASSFYFLGRKAYCSRYASDPK